MGDWPQITLRQLREGDALIRMQQARGVEIDYWHGRDRASKLAGRGMLLYGLTIVEIGALIAESLPAMPIHGEAKLVTLAATASAIVATGLGGSLLRRRAIGMEREIAKTTRVGRP